MAFPAQHRTKLHSTDPIEPLNGEIKRRTDVVGIFPNEASTRRLVGDPDGADRGTDGPARQIHDAGNARPCLR